MVSKLEEIKQMLRDKYADKFIHVYYLAIFFLVIIWTVPWLITYCVWKHTPLDNEDWGWEESQVQNDDNQKDTGKVHEKEKQD